MKVHIHKCHQCLELSLTRLFLLHITTSQTVSFISMINYFSCHFLLMLSYHLLRYSLSLPSSISTIQYLNQQFNTDIPSQDHFIIVKSGIVFFIFSLSIETLSTEVVSFLFTWQLFDVSRSFWNWRFERWTAWPVDATFVEEDEIFKPKLKPGPRLFHPDRVNSDLLKQTLAQQLGKFGLL